MLYCIFSAQVPKPTTNGEIWVFNRSYTQYIPLSIYDLQVIINYFDLSVPDSGSMPDRIQQVLKSASVKKFSMSDGRQLTKDPGIKQ
jgi:hypothetical protein